MCDSLCALPASASTGVALFAKNSDRPPDEAQDLEWHPPRRDAGPLAATHIDVDAHRGDTHGVLGSRPRWMWGMEHGVNTAGLAVGNEAIWTTENPARYPDALTGMDIVRLTLERAGSAAEGVTVLTDLVERYGQGGACHESGRRYWSSFLLCDPVAAFVVETSGRTLAVESVDGHRALSNRTTIPAFDADHGLDSPLVEALVDPRLAASRAVLDRRPVSVEDLRGHLRSHAGGADGWTICMHAGDEATTAGMVATLPERGALVARVALGQPCRSIFVPVVVGHPLGPVPSWERFAALRDATGTDPAGAEAVDRLLALEADLDAGIATRSADPDWNAAAWQRVGALLDDLGVPGG